MSKLTELTPNAITDLRTKLLEASNSNTLCVINEESKIFATPFKALNTIFEDKALLLKELQAYDVQMNITVKDDNFIVEVEKYDSVVDSPHKKMCTLLYTHYCYYTPENVAGFLEDDEVSEESVHMAQSLIKYINESKV